MKSAEKPVKQLYDSLPGLTVFGLIISISELFMYCTNFKSLTDNSTKIPISNQYRSFTYFKFCSGKKECVWQRKDGYRDGLLTCFIIYPGDFKVTVLC